MGIALSSLRIRADLDVSDYTRGAAQKVAADQRMIEADRARNAVLAQVDAATQNLIPGMAGVSKALLQGYSSGAQFEAMLRRINNAVDRGMGLDRAQLSLDALYRKFGLTVDAAGAAERGLVGLVSPAQQASAAFEAQVEAARRAQAAITDLATAQRAQAAINGTTGVNSKPATDLGATFSALADREDAAAEAAQRLRSAIDPMGAEFASLGKQMASYKKLLDDGYISSQEYEQAQVMLAKRLTDVEMNLKKGATAGRVMSGEMANLGYQVNDVVTGLMLGQSPFMIFAQQGGQIFQIFSASKASIADFGAAAVSWLGRFLTAGTVAFGGITAGIGIALGALNSYVNAQQKVNMGLLGSGRASGATNESINQIAQAGSSSTGLSISEAREFATALAQTGKIANDNLLPIVKMGKDISHVFGVDASEAAKMLADAFMDPVKGADSLNQRLGFLDAGMRSNIQNLAAQNNLYGAQRVLMEGVKSSLSDVESVVSGSTKFWTAFGNAISNAWDKTGEFIAKGLGGFENLEQKIARTRAELQEMESYQVRTPIFGSDLGSGGDIAGPSAEDIRQKREELEKLVAVQMRLSSSGATAAAAQKSFLQESTIRSLLPEISEQEKLNNTLTVLQGLLSGLANNEAAGEMLKQLGLSMKQLTDAMAVATDKAARFKTAFEAAQTNAKIAFDSVTAFSPTAKAEIAKRQAEEQFRTSGMGPDQQKTLAAQAYTLALQQSTVALSEAGRARELTARQAIDSAQLEIDMVGKSIGQQAAMRGNMQARQTLIVPAVRMDGPATTPKPANENKTLIKEESA